MCVYRRRRHKKNTTFLHFSQPWHWNVDGLTENDPVTLADAIDPSAEEKDQVSMQLEPTPGVCYMHSVNIRRYIYRHINYRSSTQVINNPVKIP